VVGGLLMGGAQGLLGGPDWAVQVGAAGAAGFAAGFFRLFSYPLEAALQIAVYLVHRLLGIRTLHLAPAAHHDLTYLPLPLLEQHILLGAGKDPAAAERVLDGCSIAPGLRSTGRRGLLRLQAAELRSLAESGDFDKASALRGRWLPGRGTDDKRLRRFGEVGRNVVGALTTRQAVYRRDKLADCLAELAGMKRDLSGETAPEVQAYVETIRVWRARLGELHASAEIEAQGRVANPFVGTPLLPPHYSRLFRGREQLIRKLDTILANREGASSLAVLGPRRCGKTSILRILPERLPDVIPIFFDLQDHPTDSPGGFVKALAQETVAQARQARGVTLPNLPEGTPFEAISRWLEMLDAEMEGVDGFRCILLCIDEFERLESLWPGDRSSLLRLMGLFRATIQHRRNVSLLVAGEAPFDELDAIWYDHFINLRVLRVEHLDEAASIDLLSRPLPGFPSDVIPTETAGEVYRRTDGQPYLLQAYGSLLIEQRNARGVDSLRPCTIADVDDVEDEFFDEYGFFFRDRYRLAPEAAKQALAELAQGRTPVLEKSVQRWLEHRALVTREGTIRIPVLAEWLRREVV